jgi:arsenical pump membrane protein
MLSYDVSKHDNTSLRIPWDLGPNVTTVGSLATVLWLLLLRRRNLEVSGLDYFKVGVVVTPLMLLAGAMTIWLLLR